LIHLYSDIGGKHTYVSNGAEIERLGQILESSNLHSWFWVLQSLQMDVL